MIRNRNAKKKSSVAKKKHIPPIIRAIFYTLVILAIGGIIRLLYIGGEILFRYNRYLYWSIAKFVLSTGFVLVVFIWALCLAIDTDERDKHDD